MSSLLFKNDIHNILPVTSTENNIKPINNIKIISNTKNKIISNTNAKNKIISNTNTSVTSSAFMNELNLNTATSPIGISQMNGGDYTNSVTSDLNSDINNLVNMLTSDSHINTINNKSNQSLENKLRKLLNQDNKQNQNGGGFNDGFNDDLNTEALENEIYNVIKNNKQKGGDFTTQIIKLGLAGTGAYLAYNMIYPNEKINTDTDTEIKLDNILKPTANPITNTKPITNTNTNPITNTKPIVTQPQDLSPTSSEYPSSGNVFIQPTPNTTTQNNTNNIFTTTDANNSSTSSFMPVNERAGIVRVNDKTPIIPQDRRVDALTRGNALTQNGGNNPALVAFRSIVKNIVTKLDIKYNKALKVASKLQAEVKSNNPSISHDKLANAAKELLDKKFKEYKEFSKSI